MNKPVLKDTHRFIPMALLVFCLLGFQPSVVAQKLITLEEAISKTLEHNFDIKIVANQLKMAEENVSMGNAGMLPNVEFLATQNNSVQYATLQQANGNEIDINGAENLNLNYGVGLNWTIFDGFRMFARHKQLKESQKLSETELRLAVLTKVSEVYASYYQLVNLQTQKKALDSLIFISEFRLETAKNRFSIGKASKLEVLNAEVDLNTDQSTLIMLDEQWNLAQIQLNQLMVQDLTTTYTVSETVVIDESLQLEKLKSLANELNPSLQAQYLNQKIQEYELKQIKAARYPTLSISTGYNLVRSQTPFGFITENNGRNFNYGLTATFNIFDGLNQNRNEKVAKINLENTEFAIAKQKIMMESQLTSLYQSYLSHRSLLEIEIKNEQIAKENLNITVDKFKIGTIPAIEFRTAQQNYANAVVRLTSAQYMAKQSEIVLKEVAGSLDF
jgi:outer membrane protein